MPNPVCPDHNLEAVVKDKVRNKKTGRLYPPFYGCPWKGTDETGGAVYCNFRFEEKPTQTAMMAGGTTSSASNQTDKDKAIAFMNAKNVAAQLFVSGVITPEGEGEVEKLQHFQDVANIVYKMQPPE